MSRAHYGFLDRDIRSMIGPKETTVENVRRELERALTALDGLSGGVLAFEHAERIADAYNALDHLTRWMPEVEAWVCGYHWGTAQRRQPWSSWSGHATEEEADAQLVHWIEREGRKRRNSSAWEVRFMPCRIGDCVRPGTDPEKVVEGTFT